MEKVQLILQLLHPYTFIPTYTVIREMRIQALLGLHSSQTSQFSKQHGFSRLKIRGFCFGHIFIKFCDFCHFCISKIKRLLSYSASQSEGSSKQLHTNKELDFGIPGFVHLKLFHLCLNLCI